MDSDDISSYAIRQAQQLERVVCDVSVHEWNGKRTFDFDLTCRHPNKPDMRSSLSIGGDGYAGNKVTFRLPKVEIEEDPYVYEEDAEFGRYIAGYDDTPQSEKLLSELEATAERINGLGSFRNCGARLIGDQHNRKSSDEITYFHPHIECRVVGENPVNDVGTVVEMVKDE